MQRNRLPLTALRSFEAAGRHLSFSRAADELFVSQAAISRQIRGLETFLGQPLFMRQHRRVELTEVGRKLLDRLVQSFDEIDSCLTGIVSSDKHCVVRVSVEPSLAACWLVPRLNRFRQLEPDIDVAIEVDARLVEFHSHEPPLALRFSYQSTSWPRTESEFLAPMIDSPVLSPALLASGHPLKSPDDLRHRTLLHEENRRGWALWFEKAGVSDVTGAERGPLLADAALSKQAALLGHGVALGDLLLVQEELAAGTLIKPFEIDVIYGGYWLVAKDFRSLSGPEKAFADWVRLEFAQSRRALKTS